MRTAKQHNAEHHGTIEVSEAAPVAFDVPIGISTDEAKLNKTERAWLEHMRLSLPTFHIGIQNVTLKIGDDCRYTPDFLCVGEGCIVFYEVKGFWRDDARVKIKVAARMFPWARFVAVQRDGKGWKQEIIKP